MEEAVDQSRPVMVVRVFACGCRYQRGSSVRCEDAERLVQERMTVAREVKEGHMPEEALLDWLRAWNEHYSVEHQEHIDIQPKLATEAVIHGRSSPRSMDEVHALKRLYENVWKPDKKRWRWFGVTRSR